MKAILIFLMFIVISIQSKSIVSINNNSKKNSFDKHSTSYRVYKIDSINNYYLIYAKKRGSRYKIVAKKEEAENCNRIRINSNYKFDLHSVRDVPGDPNSGKKSLQVSCFDYGDSTIICLEGDSIRDLYYSDNIKGLCFIKIRKK
jgi:hypothetical protein